MVSKKRTDKKALRELVAQVKEWKKDNKGTSAELYLSSPPKTFGNFKTSSDSKKHAKEFLDGHSRTFLAKEAALTPKTLQRIDAGNKFTVGNKSSQGDLSNEELTIDHGLLQRNDRYNHVFTMHHTGPNSRGSPNRQVDKAAYSPVTLPDLQFGTDIKKGPSFSRFYDMVQIKGLRDSSNDYSIKEHGLSQSPYTLTKLSYTEDMLLDRKKSPRSGSATAKRLESAADMQNAIDQRQQEKIKHLGEENQKLKEDNAQYKQEIVMLGRRIETLASQMKESFDDSQCSQCNCGKNSDFETQAKKIKRLEQTNASLQAKLKLPITSIPRTRSPSQDQRILESSPVGDIATSRMLTKKQEINLESERKKALVDLNIMTTKYEALEKENAILKQSKIF